MFQLRKPGTSWHPCLTDGFAMVWLPAGDMFMPSVVKEKTRSTTATTTATTTEVLAERKQILEINSRV